MLFWIWMWIRRKYFFLKKHNKNIKPLVYMQIYDKCVAIVKFYLKCIICWIVIHKSHCIVIFWFEFFILFKGKYLEIQVMFIELQSLKLYFTKTLWGWNIYSCYHTKIYELKEGLTISPRVKGKGLWSM